MVPIEVVYSMCYLHPESLIKAFSGPSKKGEIINKIFRHAYNHFEGYVICDPVAVAIAILPELVTTYVEK